jgi:hypothetical protein
LIRGHISKRLVRSWLENYQSLVGGDIIPELISNSGPKEYDNIPIGLIHKIMLDEAIKALPRPERDCVFYRWIMRLSLSQCLKRTGLEKSGYYGCCDKAVRSIYRYINGLGINYSELLAKTIDLKPE